MIWTAKHDEGLLKAYQALKAQIGKVSSSKEVKEKLHELGWSLEPPSDFYDDTPGKACQRALGRMLIADLAIQALERK